MKRDWTRLAVGIAVLTIAALLAIALVKAGHACANPSKRAALKIVEANGCIEFWLNRYQSLIGAIAAILAAAVAWLAVARQTSIQQYANHISEISFWQSKVDAANRALLAITIARANVERLRLVLQEAPDKGLPLLSSINRLIDAGRIPLPIADVTAMGPVGARYGILANVVENIGGASFNSRLNNAPMEMELAALMTLDNLKELEGDLRDAWNDNQSALEFAAKILEALDREQ